MKKIIFAVAAIGIAGYYLVHKFVLNVNNDINSIKSEVKPSSQSYVPSDGMTAPNKAQTNTHAGTPMSADAYIYVSNLNTTTVSVCPLFSDGNIGTCAGTGANFNAPSGLSISHDNKILYVTNQGSNETDACQIDPVSGSLNSCVATGNDFNAPSALAISPNGLFAYVTNENGNSVSRCNHDRGTHLLSGCEQALDGLMMPSDINFGPAGSGRVYIANSENNTVLLCTIGLAKGLVKCQSTGNDFSSPQSVTVSFDGRFAYVTNQAANNVNLCQINQTSGELFSCTATGSDFNAPSDFTLNRSGNVALISEVDSIMKCNVASDGNLTGCQQYNGNFNHSTGIRVFNK